MSQVGQYCCNIGYDVLTIFISIADVATDVIVLIDFYNKDRMIFFGISLAILILAQCAYSMAFALKFEIDRWNLVKSCCCFLCILPFGTFIAFCFYCADQDGGSERFRSVLEDVFDLRINNSFSQNNSHSRMMKWMRAKLNKHLGFLLEAVIEAFPQSLLQIIAIVVYQEANYISIISILLSMFSVTTKSLILSQGIEKYTFVWSWLCAVSDFFGIFFTLTWVFYTNDLIHGEYWGYFNIFGAIWIWKFLLSTASIAVTGCVLFWSAGYWIMGSLFCCDTSHEPDACRRCGEGCVWFLLSPILCIIAAFGTCLACEVFCFSMLAYGIYKFSTKRIVYWRNDRVNKMVHWMLDFISNGKDKTLRILAINHAMYEGQRYCLNVESLIKKTLEEEGYEGLRKISYNDLRNGDQGFIKQQLGNICSKWNDYRDISTNECAYWFFDTTKFTMYTLMAFIFGPILMISKVLQVFYPWIIIGYLGYNGLLFVNEIDMFQMVMLWTYVGLQLIVLFLGIHVFRMHWWLRHIEPDSDYCYLDGLNKNELREGAHKWYESICWYPKVEKIVLDTFGNDIGPIIMHYCKSFELSKDDEI